MFTKKSKAVSLFPKKAINSNNNFNSIFNNEKNYHTKQQRIGFEIYYKNKLIAISYKLPELYNVLKTYGIFWNQVMSKKILLRNVNCLIIKDKAFLFEFRCQRAPGDMCQKLQNCEFKLNSFSKLLAPLELKVEYIYILNDWFKDIKYKDTLDYILSVGCKYYFNYLPFHRIGLPVLDKK